MANSTLQNSQKSNSAGKGQLGIRPWTFNYRLRGRRDATRMMKKMAKFGNGSFLLIDKGQDPTELLADEIKLRSRIQ